MSKKNKRKSKKKLKLDNLIIGIIALVLIIGGGIYYIKNKDNPKLPNILKPPKVEEKVKIVDMESKSRPYAVMINNIGAARPLQSGLQDAYIIYEMIVEGGLTRYLALFQDANVERIGSIRSARHYFLDYVLENDAIYVYHGQSPQAGTDFNTLKLDRISVNNTSTGWRDKTLKVNSEHTLFTSTEKLATGTTKLRKERNGDYLFNYNVKSLDHSEVENKKEANNVMIEYSGSMKTSYSYDPDTKLYKRSVNDKAHTDYVTKEQYTFKNIIVYEVGNQNISGDTSGRQNLNNIGTSDGYYISEGIAVPIKVEKKSRSGKTIYKYENGEELVLNDGNTFIHLQPKNKKLEID